MPKQRPLDVRLSEMKRRLERLKTESQIKKLKNRLKELRIR